MRHTPLCIGIFCILLLCSFVQPALASDPDACQAAIGRELARELRIFRAVVYGEIAATGATVGHVKYDSEGDPWIKTGAEDNHAWASIKGNKNRVMNNEEAGRVFGISTEEAAAVSHGTIYNENGLLWTKINGRGYNEWHAALVFQSDEDMEKDAEVEPRRGIFETRRVLTTELVPYLVSSMRALQCRTKAICEGAQQTILSSENGTPEYTEPLGCQSIAIRPMPECQFGGTGTYPNAEAALSYCPPVQQQMLEREAELLKFAVEYDAAYRSLLQIAGNMDLSLRELHWPFTATIRHSAALIGKLAHIPCFLSSCDASPIPFPDQ